MIGNLNFLESGFKNRNHGYTFFTVGEWIHILNGNYELIILELLFFIQCVSIELFFYYINISTMYAVKRSTFIPITR